MLLARRRQTAHQAEVENALLRAEVQALRQNLAASDRAWLRAVRASMENGVRCAHAENRRDDIARIAADDSQPEGARLKQIRDLAEQEVQGG